MDSGGEVIVLAGQGGEEREGKQCAAVMGIMGVVGDRQKQFGCQVLDKLLPVGLEESTECFKGILKIEVTAFDDYPPQTVLEHLAAAVAHLSQHIDHPSPLLALSHPPADFGQHFGDDLAVDDQVAQQQQGVGVVGVDEESS